MVHPLLRVQSPEVVLSLKEVQQVVHMMVYQLVVPPTLDVVNLVAQGAALPGIPAAHLSPSERLSREQTVADELHGFVIDIVVGRLSQFGQHVYDEQLDLVRLQEREKDGADKGDHESAGIGVLPSASHSRYSW